MKTILKLFFIYNFSITLFWLSGTKALAQNIGINGTGALPHTSTLLDIDAVATPSLGILIPRIALQAINLSAPVASPATSLLVYNIASAGSGTNAVVPAYYYWDGIQWQKFNIGNIANYGTWNITGNVGTTTGTNFMGTNDDIDVIFKRNSKQSGLINSAKFNTSFGVLSLNAVTTGSNNSIFGWGINTFHSTGSNHTYLGINVSNTLTAYGNDNNAIGYYCLTSNTGSNNCAFGDLNLRWGSNNTGYSNVAFGAEALAFNSSGFNNVGIGNQTFYNNQTNSNNTVIGSLSLGTGTGSLNVVLGSTIMWSNGWLGSCTMLGGGCPNSLVGIGYKIGNNQTSGDNNIIIGTNFDLPNLSGSNQIQIGNANITYAGTQVAWTITSDKKWKENIRSLPYGINLIKQLRPVDYTRIGVTNTTNEIGFIAQEVEQTLNNLGINNHGMLSKDSDGALGIRYNDFIAVLVKGMQEQQIQLKQQDDEVAQLIKEIELLSKH